MTAAAPVVLGAVVLSNGSIGVLAGDLSSANPSGFITYYGFDHLQVAVLPNSTPVTLNQSTGLSFPSGGSPNNGFSNPTIGGGSIAAIPTGGMAVLTWGDTNVDYYLQVLNNSGAVTTAPFVVASQTTTGPNGASNPDGAVVAWSGGLVVAWSTDNIQNLYYERFSLAGVASNNIVHVASAPGTSTGWQGIMSVDSLGNVIFGFGTGNIYAPGTYKEYNSSNTLVGSGAVANTSSSPDFAALSGGGFVTVGYTPVGTYNSTTGHYTNFTMNVQKVSTAGTISTVSTTTNAVAANSYQTANIDYIGVLQNGTVEFQESRDYGTNKIDTFNPTTNTLVRQGATAPEAYGSAGGPYPDFDIAPTVDGNGFVGVGVNGSNQLVAEGLSAAPPSAPTITGISPDSGSSSADGVTNTGSLTVSGSGGAAGETITLFNGSTQIGVSSPLTGSTWSVTLSSPLAQGSYSLTATATASGLTSSASSGFAVKVDTTAPTVSSINRVGNATNNAGSEAFTVTFSESVTGVDNSDFTAATSGTTDTGISVTGSGTTYTVTVAGVAGNGTLGLNLKASSTGIADTAGNAISGGFTGQTYTIDQTPPTVSSINRVANATNNASSEAFTVTFSESVTGVDNSDFTAATSGTTDTGITVTGSGATYTVTVAGVAGNGTLGLNLKGSGTSIVDTAGNAISGGFTGQTYTIDHTPPTVSSINRVASATNNASSEQFAVVFSEAVTGVVASDFALTTTNTPGGTALTTGGIISITTSDNTTYSVTVGSVAGDGTLRLDLKSNSTGITDTAGNGATAAFTSGQVYTIDHTPPAVSSINTVASSPNNASTESFTVTFSEAVTGVDATDFTAIKTGTAADTSLSITGSGTTYTITANGVTGDGALGLNLNASGTNIVDAAGNAIAVGFTGQTYMVDHTPPTVSSINTVASSPNNAGSDQFTIVFSEAVTGVDAADFTAIKTGTAADTSLSITGSGTTYTVTANGVTGDGALGLNLNASSTNIIDAAGNAIAGGFTGQVYTVDHTPPTVSSINTVGSIPNNASSDAFTVVFSEAVTGVDATDFTPITTGSAADTSLTITGSGTTYTVTANGVTGDGTLGLNLNASGTDIVDAAGNAMAAGFTGQTYTIQHTPPSVSSIDLVGSMNNNASSESFTVIFSESVTGVDAADFAAALGGTVADTSLSIAGSGTTYTVTANGVTGDGTLGLNLNASGTDIVDAAGNAISGGFTGQVYSVGHTPPSVASITRVGSNPNNATTEQFDVDFSEDVTGVDASDFTPVTNGITDTGVTVLDLNGVNNASSIYRVTVSGVTGDGTLGLNLNASGTGITDAFGSAIAGGFTLGDVYTIEQTPPSVSSITRAGSTPTNSSIDAFTVTFSEAVTGVDASDFTAVASGGVTDTGGLTVTPVSGNVYTVTANDVTGNGTLGLDLNASGTNITDGAGNAISGGFTAGEVYTIDKTSPTVSSITLAGSSPNNASSDQWTVTFSEAVTDVDANNFAVATTGTAADTGLSITGSGTTYTVTANGVTGDGTLGLNVLAGAGIEDLAGNPISAGFTGQVYTIQHTPLFQANVPTLIGPYLGLYQWSVAGNWSTGVVPASGDIDISNATQLVDDEASLSIGNLIFPASGVAMLTVNGELTIANLEFGAASTLLASTLISGGASSAAVTINGLANPAGAATIEAAGAGAIITVNAVDEGETYQAQSQGKIVLSSTPAFTSTFSASSGGAVGFNIAPGTIANAVTIASGGGVEVQGTTLVSSSYNSSAHTETITTDAGTYVFTDWLGLARNLSGGVDATTGLLDLTAASTGSASNPALSNDVDGNGLGGLLWQENGTGRVAVWDMNSTNFVDFGYFSSPGPTWNVLTSGDFNGDGKSDAILEDTTGQIVEWQFNGIEIANATYLPYTGSADWQAKTTGDFNGDGLSDIALQNTDGSIAIWEMNGANIIANGASIVTNPGPNWQAITTGDFFGTGQSELALQNTTDGSLQIMGFDDSVSGPVLDNAHSSVFSPALDPGADWRLAGTGDFNGDAKSDFVFQNTDGSVAVWEMNGANLLSPTSAAVVGNPGSTWRLDAVADFNGDGTSDLMFQDSQTGLVQIWQMNGLNVASQTTLTDYNPGTSWHPIA